MLISGLCVVHCIAVPLVIVLFPAIGLQIFPQEDLTHAVLFAFILGTAGLAFVSGYRVHGQWQPVAWLVVGLIIVSFATFFVHRTMGHMWEPIFAIAGSLCLIRAHYLNHTCKKCLEDHAEHHHDDPTSKIHDHERKHHHGHSHKH